MYVKARQWIRETFVVGSRPTMREVAQWVQDGELDGKLCRRDQPHRPPRAGLGRIGGHHLTQPNPHPATQLIEHRFCPVVERPAVAQIADVLKLAVRPVPLLPKPGRHGRVTAFPRFRLLRSHADLDVGLTRATGEQKYQ